MTAYSRENPSPRYQELVGQYKAMHIEGDKNYGLPAQETFPGFRLKPHVARIRKMIEETKSGSILDYGSGKGIQYDVLMEVPDISVPVMVLDFWDVDEVHCYDPAYEPNSKLPDSKFDGVICTDVLEHCPEEDLPWIIDEIFSLANRFVYANVACFPAIKSLPNGENAHCTQQEPEWWRDLFRTVVPRYPDIVWQLWSVAVENYPQGNGKMVEICFSSD